MLKNTISITEARKKIFDIADEVQKPNNFYTLTERGRAKAVIISADKFDSMVEIVGIKPKRKHQTSKNKK